MAAAEREVSVGILSAHELQHVAIAYRCTPDDARLVHRNALREAGGALRRRIGNEGGHDSALHTPDVNPPMEPGVVAVLPRRCARLRIGDIQDVVVNADTARTPELPPFGDELATRGQDLDAVVGAVADKDAPGRVEGE